MRLILLSYYFVLLPVWVALIVVMVSADLDPLDTWLGIPVGLTLLTAGIHLVYFRREHVQLTRRILPRRSRYAFKLEVTIRLVDPAFVVFGVVLLISGLLSL